MSNVLGNTAAGLTATLGVFGMDVQEFSPTTIFFYCLGVGIVAFVVSFIVEAAQTSFGETWRNMRNKHKGKKNDLGLGNRHF